MRARNGGHRVSLRQRPRPAPFRSRVLKRLVRRAAARLSPAGSDLRILVVGDEEMTRWNRDFLGRSGTTNVISFPEEALPRGAVAAGDIVVSAPTCLAQTAAWPGTAEERVLFFILHGMVHLLGHDHERGAGAARRMRRLESRVYRAVVGESPGGAPGGTGARPPAGPRAPRKGRGFRIPGPRRSR